MYPGATGRNYGRSNLAEKRIIKLFRRIFVPDGRVRQAIKASLAYLIMVESTINCKVLPDGYESCRPDGTCRQAELFSGCAWLAACRR